MDGKDYDYSQAGFDNFLSRSIDNLNKVNLDSPGPQTRKLAFDRSQVSGLLGDTLRLGRINLNGASGNIILNDGDNDRVLLGEDDF